MLNGSLAQSLPDITMSSYGVVNLFRVYFAPLLCFVLFVLFCFFFHIIIQYFRVYILKGSPIGIGDSMGHLENKQKYMNPMLCFLHWLSKEYKIKFKLLVLIATAFPGICTGYQRNYFLLHSTDCP